MAKQLIGIVQCDGGTRTGGGAATRQANDHVEFYARPLSYGDLSEVAVTVWADGKVHLTIRDNLGRIVDQHNYTRPSEVTA